MLSGEVGVQADCPEIVFGPVSGYLLQPDGTPSGSSNESEHEG